MRAIPVLFAALVGSQVIGQTWNHPAPALAPSPRRAGAMAFDGVSNRLLLHGGLYASPSLLLEETWSYNGTWTLLAPTTSMPGRWGHRLVRDTVRNRLLTFGGRSPTISAFASDTWAWNGSGWANLPTTAAPAPRYLYGLAFDHRRDRVVLFGGRTVNASPNDTWEFDGTDWAQIPTAHAPSPREDMVFVHDTGRATTVLFGGLDPTAGTLANDTWEYDGSDWRQAAPPMPPTARYRCAADYDSRRQRIVVYGGYDGQQVLTQTLEYGGEDWTVVGVGPGSPDATEAFAGFDPARSRFVTFGGVGTVFSAETWEFTGAATAQFGTFGNGCPTSTGVPGLGHLGQPQLGQSFDVVFDGLPPTTGFLLLAEGFSALTWNGNPLPFDLGAVGAAGCGLEVAPDALFGLGAAGATAVLTVVVPNATSLTGLAWYVQAFAPDAAAPNGFGGMSRAGRAVFGN